MALKTRVENLSARPQTMTLFSCILIFPKRDRNGWQHSTKYSRWFHWHDKMLGKYNSCQLAQRNEKCIRRHQSTRPWCQVSWKIFGGKIWDRQWSLFTSLAMPKMNRQKSFMFYFVHALILAQEKKVSTLHFTYPKQENPLWKSYEKTSRKLGGVVKRVKSHSSPPF